MDTQPFPLTRAGALARLDQFVKDGVADYGARRNHVDPAGRHNAVSRLSPALRRRVISEEEVVRAVLMAHPLDAVEKFVAEVFWRTYWKGWLEHRPGIWHQTLREAEAYQAQVQDNPALAKRHAAGTTGCTGIAAFDHWVHELRDTGYLHNWARMQVASIWVFTLGLPWQLGAEWMFAHLADADPASNSLSWRWVAGLHTAGKAYLADEARIGAMTGGELSAKGLARVATLPPPSPAPAATALRQPVAPVSSTPSLLLLTCEDLSLETQLQLNDLRGIVIPTDLLSGPADRQAMADAAARAAAHWPGTPLIHITLDELPGKARELDCAQIVTAFLPTGPVANAVERLRQQWMDAGLTLAEHQRRWDTLAWPFCTKGFFHLKSRIPDLLHAQGLLAG